MKKLLFSASLFTLIMVLLAGVTLAATPVNVGDSAPDFTLYDLSGKQVTLSDFKGHVVLLNFWGTFCPPCRSEMPALNNLYLALKDKGFMLLGVSLDKSEKTVRNFILAEETAFPILMDPDKSVYNGKYATFALPLTFLIDKQGKVIEKFFGKQAWDSPAMIERIKLMTEGR